MTHVTPGKNIGICFSRPMSPRFEFFVWATDSVIDQCVIGNKSAGAGGSSLAPIYLLEGKKQVPNLSKNVLELVSELAKSDPAKEFFGYLYAVLNSMSYKRRYEAPLKSDFPRVQLTTDKVLFRRLSEAGLELADIHLLKDHRLDGGDVSFSGKGTNRIEFVKYDEKKQRVAINGQQAFEKVTRDSWTKEFGGYQVLEKWLKDRKGKILNYKEISHYEKIAAAIDLHNGAVSKLDRIIQDAGGWPIAKLWKQKRTTG